MKESSQPNEKTLRLRYIRILEKFLTRVSSLLKNQDFDLKIFKKNVEKYYQEILKVKAIRLDSEYLNMLQDFINSTLAKTNTSQDDDDFSEKRNSLLKEINILAKEKNKSNYKKDKHKDKDFYDGY